MKKIKIITVSFLLILIVCLQGCNKDNGTSSRPTYWPSIKLNGSELVTIIVGDSYNDAGATATEGGTPSTVTTDNPVDTSKAGYYTITYSATNKDGITVSKQRVVIVSPGAVTNDVSYIEGKYSTPGGTTPSTTYANITKVAPGVYYTENCWGNGSLAILPAYFFCLDGVTLIVPNQGEGAGQVESVEPGTYDVPTSTITWTIVRPLFPGGALIRTKNWIKV